MHETVSGERPRAREERPAYHSGGCSCGCEDRSARMKKMFMMMMMSDLL